jgi:hypothetical protein
MFAQCALPAGTRSGTARASAFVTASCMTSPGSTVPSDVATGYEALQIDPSGAVISTRRRHPSLCGMSGSRAIITGIPPAACSTAYDALMLPSICGELPAKSTRILSPSIVSEQRIVAGSPSGPKSYHASLS